MTKSPCEKIEKSKSKQLIPYFQLVFQDHPHSTIAYYVSRSLLVILDEQFPNPFVESSHALIICYLQ